MKNILTPLAVAALAGSLSAQTTVLSEDFSTGVPPTGWTMMNNNANPLSAGWIHDALNGRAWHEDELTAVGQTDNTLMTPAMDLTGLTSVALHWDNETNYGRWLGNHPNSTGNGVSTVEVTTDGGGTWTVVWTDNSLGSLLTSSPSVDLSAWAGMANVQVGFHFTGTYAQEWWVDNVVVNDDVVAMSYSIEQLADFTGNYISFNVDAATPGGTVMLGYSTTGAGPTNTPFGVVDMSLPINTLASMTADAAGGAAFSATTPAGTSGLTLYTQGVDLASGSLTNSLAEVIL